MASNATYVFLDLGTTGGIKDISKLKITELCMIAVRQDRLLGPCYPVTQDTPAVPRVQQKLTLCFNPGETISYNAKPGGGFTDDDLAYEITFDESFDLIDHFLNILSEPVYLVAHNGFSFDFPILKRHLKGKSFSKDVMCVDTYYGFYDILNAKSATGDIVQSLANLRLNSDTPKKKISEIRQDNAERVKSPPWGGWKNKPKEEYKLTTVYERIVRREPEDAHKADIDCQLMLRIAVIRAKEFVAWADAHHSSFAEHVEPTTPVKMEMIRTSGTREAGASDNKEAWDAESKGSRDKEAVEQAKSEKATDVKPTGSKFGDAESQVDSKTPMRKKDRNTGTSRILSGNFQREMDMEAEASDSRVGVEPINSKINKTDKNVRTLKGNNDPGVDPIASGSGMVGDGQSKVSRGKEADKKPRTPKDKTDAGVDPTFIIEPRLE